MLDSYCKQVLPPIRLGNN